MKNKTVICKNCGWEINVLDINEPIQCDCYLEDVDYNVGIKVSYSEGQIGIRGDMGSALILDNTQ